MVRTACGSNAPAWLPAYMVGSNSVYSVRASFVQALNKNEAVVQEKRFEMKRRIRILVVALAALSLIAVAQNSNPETVVDIAAGNPDFSVLVTAVQTAGLVETLSSEGPFTVFAPTDAAFADALAALGVTADDLLGREDLAEILTYHVVPGSVLAADVLAAVEAGGGEFMVTTVNGAEISITVVDGMVMLNGAATVTVADLMAGNGVVHVIDAVLLPPTE